VDCDTIYLLEAYLPRTCAGGPAAATARARRAAADLRRGGTSIRLLRAFFLPEDELCFCLYEAGSLELVAEAGRLAELAVGRIQQAVELTTTEPEATNDDERSGKWRGTGRSG